MTPDNVPPEVLADAEQRIVAMLEHLRTTPVVEGERRAFWMDLDGNIHEGIGGNTDEERAQVEAALTSGRLDPASDWVAADTVTVAEFAAAGLPAPEVAARDDGKVAYRFELPDEDD